MNEPLAVKLRPQKLKDVVGQKHLVGEGKILNNLVKNNKLFSMILYGNPGIGKTTIALCLVNELGCKYRCLNAVINNKKDFDIVVEEAKLYNGIVLIMDEIHRLNKDKQDLLLPLLENGLITLIGLTSSNPYHTINPAIRSRCQLFKLEELTTDDIILALKNATQSKELEGIKVDEESLKYIASLSSSDLRFAYNLLEVCYYSVSDKKITLDIVKSINNTPNIFHDKDGDNYYDLLSAFQKSIRGSDVQASLYYLARLLEGGELEAICRRLQIIVYEDIGLANSSMGPKVVSACIAAREVGMPEATIILGTIIIEMALSPKSNSGESAINNAINTVKNNGSYPVPSHIKKNNPAYKYPHNYKNSIVKQEYLPKELKGSKFYIPRENTFENKLKIIMENLEKINK